MAAHGLPHMTILESIICTGFLTLLFQLKFYLPSERFQRCASSAGLDTRQWDVVFTLARAYSALSELIWSGLVFSKTVYVQITVKMPDAHGATGCGESVAVEIIYLFFCHSP